MSSSKISLLIMSLSTIHTDTLNTMLDQFAKIRTYQWSPDGKISKKINGIVMIYESPIERYINHYFQTCTDPMSITYFGNQSKILQTSTQSLITNFKTIDWNHLDTINYDILIMTLSKQFNLSIQSVTDFIYSNRKHQLISGQYLSNPIPIILLKSNTLTSLVNVLNKAFNLKLILSNQSEQTESVWYQHKYQKFVTQFNQLYTFSPNVIITPR